MKGSDVATRIGRILRNFRMQAGMAGAMVLWATVAQAAPYAAYVMDARTGEVLYQKNADARLHPASLTKMLTLYICFDAIRRGEISLDTTVTVSREAASQPPSHLGLRPGQKIKLRYLIRAAAVKSANDAAWAIGDAISGNVTQFAKRMNATAKKLGMEESHFENPNGLTLAGHLSSAHDMAILGRHLFFDFPQYYNIFSRRSTYAGVAEVYSTNRRFLNSYEGADGIKTGYTYASGFNLVASAKRGNKRIIAAEFGGTSVAERNAQMTRLLDLGFKRAPNRAAIQRPKAPNLDRIAALYGKNAPEQAVMVASADATVDTSPRPEPRPSAASAAPPKALMVAMKDEISSALGKVEDGNAAAAAATETANETASVDPLDVSPVPARRPGAETAQQVAAADTADMPDATSTDVAVKAAVPEADRTDIGTDGQANMPPPPRPAALVTAAAPAPATAPASRQTAQIEAVQPTASDATAPVARPATKPADSGIVFASIAPRDVPKPEARPEIVTRMSTSGGRNWGVNVGRFPSQFQAEKALLRTALAESSALSDGLRKVVRRPNGYDANFVGLTQDQAALACARLQARNIQCFSLAP